jgi:hypothetical protein
MTCAQSGRSRESVSSSLGILARYRRLAKGCGIGIRPLGFSSFGDKRQLCAHAGVFRLHLILRKITKFCGILALSWQALKHLL